MANSLGPSRHPTRCAAKHVFIQSVRTHRDARTLDIVVQSHPSGDEQILRLSRLEALSVLEAMRRVLSTPDVDASWSPAALEGEIIDGTPTQTPAR
jgi:hypothetical protein